MLRTQIRIGALDKELHTQRVEVYDDRIVRPGWKRRNIDIFREFGELKEPVLRRFNEPGYFEEIWLKRLTKKQNEEKQRRRRQTKE